VSRPAGTPTLDNPLPVATKNLDRPGHEVNPAQPRAVANPAPPERVHRCRQTVRDLALAAGAVEVQVVLAAAAQMGDDVGDVPPRPAGPLRAVIVSPGRVAQSAIQLNGKPTVAAGRVGVRCDVVFEVAFHALPA
jgi:hypothetical protein